MSLALLLAAAAAATEPKAPFCAERPGKANGTCTVPVGSVQIETGLVDWARTEAAGTRSDSTAIGVTFVKVGVSGSSDLELGFTPYATVTTRQNGARTHASGAGDTVVRYKQRLSSRGSAVQLALIPFVKLPTANENLGNGKIEGGLAVPISFQLTRSVTATLGSELDLLADSDRSGRHVGLVNLVNLSVPIAPKWTAGAEIWTNFNFDPAGTVRQASVDATVAYLAADNLQLDAGANWGMTRETADVELYTGVTVRF